MRIGVLLASVRENRRGEPFARWIHSLLAARPEVDAELIDLKDWLLPAYTYPTNPMLAEKSYPEGTLAHRWVEKIQSHDAFVVVTPEYNHGYPGHLKTAMDHAYAAWNYKPIAFVSYGGLAAGSRAIEQLCLVAIELRMVPIRDSLAIPLIGLTVDPLGYPTTDLVVRRAATLVDELLWWTGTLGEARGKRPR